MTVLSSWKGCDDSSYDSRSEIQSPVLKMHIKKKAGWWASLPSVLSDSWGTILPRPWALWKDFMKFSTSPFGIPQFRTSWQLSSNRQYTPSLQPVQPRQIWTQCSKESQWRKFSMGEILMEETNRRNGRAKTLNIEKEKKIKKQKFKKCMCKQYHSGECILLFLDISFYFMFGPLWTRLGNLIWWTVACFLKFIRILLYSNPLLKNLFLALDCPQIQLARFQLHLPSI